MSAPVDISFERSALSAWIERNRGYTLDDFDRHFKPHWHFPIEWLYAVTICESMFKANAYNEDSGASGLWQGVPAWKEWKMAVVSTHLPDHIPMLKAMNAMYKRENVQGWVEMYMRHFLPEAGMKYQYENRFTECHVMGRPGKERYGSASMQYASIIRAPDGLLIPAIDVFAFYQRIALRCSEMGVSVEVNTLPVYQAVSSSKEHSHSVEDCTIYTKWADKVGYDAALGELVPKKDPKDYGPWSVPGTVARLRKRSAAATKMVTFSLDGEVGEAPITKNRFLAVNNTGAMNSMSDLQSAARYAPPVIVYEGREFILNPLTKELTPFAKRLGTALADATSLYGVYNPSDDEVYEAWEKVKDNIDRFPHLQRQYQSGSRTAVTDYMRAKLPHSLAKLSAIATCGSISVKYFEPVTVDDFAHALSAHIRATPPSVLLSQALQQQLYAATEPRLVKIGSSIELPFHGGVVFPYSLMTTPMRVVAVGDLTILSEAYLVNPLRGTLKSTALSFVGPPSNGLQNQILKAISDPEKRLTLQTQFSAL